MSTRKKASQPSSPNKKGRKLECLRSAFAIVDEVEAVDVESNAGKFDEHIAKAKILLGGVDITCFSHHAVNQVKETRKRKIIHICDTSFFNQIELSGGVEAAIKKLPKEWRSLSKIVIPIHRSHGNMGHWSVAIVRPMASRVDLFDSKSMSTRGGDAYCLPKMEIFLEKMDAINRYKRITPWIFKKIKDIVTQENEFDCGIFTCLYIYCAVNDFTIPAAMSKEEVFKFRKFVAIFAQRSHIRTLHNE
jgi:Ulp1 family protease